MLNDLRRILALSLTLFVAYPRVLAHPKIGWHSWLNPSPLHQFKRNQNVDTNPNGSTFLWLIEDEYVGDTFFECVDFLFPVSFFIDLL
jgi:hypothetical protein